MTQYDIYFGTYSKGKGNGLFRGVFDSGSGKIRLVSTIDVENPSYLQLKGNILYGVSELVSFYGENGGALFSIDVKAPKKMRLIDIQATHGKHPCHLFIKDNNIFVSNYTEGSLSIFNANMENIQPSVQSLHHFGNGARADRQEASHIHFAAATPDGKYIAVCDLGMDKVFLYPWRAEGGISTNAAIICCPPGSGPRHFVFSGCGRYMYVLTELSNTILVYQYNDGAAKLIQEISTLPYNFSGKSSAAAIHLSPCGRYVAASNRGHDSIVFYGIADNGMLALTSFIITGREPRDFRFSPCGNWLLSANQNDDSVTVYNINNSLKQTDDEAGSCDFKLPKPVCILFGESIGKQ